MPNLIIATPDAMIRRDTDKKMGLIKDFKGLGAVINSAVPIQDNMAPDLTIICKLNQLRKSKP
jgi:hypothetical protein